MHTWKGFSFGGERSGAGEAFAVDYPLPWFKLIAKSINKTEFLRYNKTEWIKKIRKK